MLSKLLALSGSPHPHGVGVLREIGRLEWAGMESPPSGLRGEGLVRWTHSADIQGPWPFSHMVRLVGNPIKWHQATCSSCVPPISVMVSPPSQSLSQKVILDAPHPASLESSGPRWPPRPAPIAAHWLSSSSASLSRPASLCLRRLYCVTPFCDPSSPTG